MFPQRMAAYNCSICTNRSTFLNQRFNIVISTNLRIFTYRVKYISKYHGRSAKDIIFQHYTFIYRNVILYLAEIAYSNIITNVYILSKYTPFTYLCTLLNVREMPDFSTIPYFAGFIDKCRFMFKVIHIHDRSEEHTS